MLSCKHGSFSHLLADIMCGERKPPLTVRTSFLVWHLEHTDQLQVAFQGIPMHCCNLPASFLSCHFVRVRSAAEGTPADVPADVPERFCAGCTGFYFSLTQNCDVAIAKTMNPNERTLARHGSPAVAGIFSVWSCFNHNRARCDLPSQS